MKSCPFMAILAQLITMTKDGQDLIRRVQPDPDRLLSCAEGNCAIYDDGRGCCGMIRPANRDDQNPAAPRGY